MDYTTEGEAGEEAEISAYIRAGDSQIVYKVPSGSYKKLAAAACNDFWHSEVLWADFSDIHQVDISLEGNSYTLTSEKDKDKSVWSYQDKDELEMGDFRSALENLTADEFTGEQPVQREEIGLTVHLDNENFPQIQIKLYRYDGSHCLAVVDGESVSLVERAAVVDLIEAIYTIVLN